GVSRQAGLGAESCVTILLDENFPLRLYRRLRADGYAVEHIIPLNQRGTSDRTIRERLALERLIFLTCDKDFAQPAAAGQSIILLSRVRQSRPIRERVDI